MNILEMVKQVETATGHGELAILEIVRRNWPGRTLFSETQAALLTRLIEGKRK